MPKDMRLGIILSECPTDFQTELTAQQHLSPDYAQILAHIFTVICSRARGLAPVVLESWNEGVGNCNASHEEIVEREVEKRTVWKLEMARKSSPKPKAHPSQHQGVDFLHIS